MRVYAHICVGCPNGCDRNGSAEVGKGFDGAAVPRRSDSGGPHEIRNEEDDDGLIQSIKYIQPEFEPGILKATNASNVELRECHGGFRVDILVESYCTISTELTWPHCE